MLDALIIRHHQSREHTHSLRRSVARMVSYIGSGTYSHSFSFVKNISAHTAARTIVYPNTQRRLEKLPEASKNTEVNTRTHLHTHARC